MCAGADHAIFGPRGEFRRGPDVTPLPDGDPDRSGDRLWARERPGDGHLCRGAGAEQLQRSPLRRGPTGAEVAGTVGRVRGGRRAGAEGGDRAGRDVEYGPTLLLGCETLHRALI